MLNTRFYEPSGGMLVETLPIFFPPAEIEKLQFEVVTATGKVIYSQQALLQPWQQFPVVDGIRPRTNGMVTGLSAGPYVFQVRSGEDLLSRVPFNLIAKSGEDPFNPQTTFTREGPWSKLGYLTANPATPEAALRFNWWARTGDLPNNKGTKVGVKILRNGKEVAEARGHFVSKSTWQSCSSSLRKAGSNQRENFTLEDLTTQDGNLQVITSAKDKVIRSFEITIKGGKVKPHPRSASGYEPQADYLVPKIISQQSGSASSAKMIDAFWLDVK